MTQQLGECVPNFSEGRDMAVIGQITDANEAVPGVTLLDVDPGAATNRTVVTFVGDPDSVVEAAVAAGMNDIDRIDRVPEFEPLRDQPEFLALLDRLQLRVRSAKNEPNTDQQPDAAINGATS